MWLAPGRSNQHGNVGWSSAAAVTITEEKLNLNNKFRDDFSSHKLRESALQHHSPNKETTEGVHFVERQVDDRRQTTEARHYASRFQRLEMRGRPAGRRAHQMLGRSTLFRALLLAWSCISLAHGETATLPRGTDQHCLISKEDAYLSAQSFQRGIAVGGRLCDGTGTSKDAVGYPCVARSGFWAAPSGGACTSSIQNFAFSACMCNPSEWGSTNDFFSPSSCELRPPAGVHTTSRDTFDFRQNVFSESLVRRAPEARTRTRTRLRVASP